MLLRTPWWYVIVRNWRLRMWLETLTWPPPVPVAAAVGDESPADARRIEAEPPALPAGVAAHDA